MQEKSLHAALKRWYAQPGDMVEQPIDGYIIDLVRGNLLIEIQTGNFGAIKAKLTTLLQGYSVRLVYPLIRDKWIVRVGIDGETMLGRRKSPKHGRTEDLFDELVSLPELLKHPRFEIEVLFVQVEEIWCDDGKGSWRRQRQSIRDRCLLGVLDRLLIKGADDLRLMLPADMPTLFTNRDLAHALELTARQAQRMSYCLRKAEVIEAVGRQGRRIMYRLESLREP